MCRIFSVQDVTIFLNLP